MKNVTRQQIVEMARSWIGTPYRHQGRTRRGVDCAGPLVNIANEIGAEGITDRLIYSRFPESFNLKEQMDAALIKVDKDKVKPGDVLLFKIDVLPQHVGIAGNYKHGGLSIIHCYQRVGRVVEHRFANVWWARLIQAYKIPNVQEDM
jgi:cell wall-associated NlpC family hydrolase